MTKSEQMKIDKKAKAKAAAAAPPAAKAKKASTRPTKPLPAARATKAEQLKADHKAKAAKEKAAKDDLTPREKRKNKTRKQQEGGDSGGGGGDDAAGGGAVPDAAALSALSREALEAQMARLLKSAAALKRRSQDKALDLADAEADNRDLERHLEDITKGRVKQVIAEMREMRDRDHAQKRRLAELEANADAATQAAAEAKATTARAAGSISQVETLMGQVAELSEQLNEQEAEGREALEAAEGDRDRLRSLLKNTTRGNEAATSLAGKMKSIVKALLGAAVRRRCPSSPPSAPSPHPLPPER